MTVHHNLTAFQPGDGQQILNQISQAIRMLGDGSEKAGGDLGIVFCAFQQSFHKTFDKRKRRAQFMADIGNEFLARALELLDSCEIVKNHDGTMVGAGSVFHACSIDFRPSCGHPR